MVHVQVVRALEDNFMYIVRNENDDKVLVVDPVEPEKIQNICVKDNLTIVGALITHHHWDHAGGTPAFRKAFPDSQQVPIFGGDDRIEHVDKILKHDEEFEQAGLKIRSLSTPCHTRGHVCYHVSGKNGPGVVFTGDTLFIAGCGKFFEGSADQMHRNLNEILASLPDSTLVYVGHEYTATNLKFAESVEPGNQKVIDKLKMGN
ncbi:unnamed protein product [Caenorhabditis auriculariae]|uniref:hydroxyacylglutathione hydrolase n=1 Tax=Caenorhabditis auriculariae TaxID=2777116 RepID=A0A8S1HR62_9PELO|nr:unnamed protein product [Caenorhabditis auriculariae]